MNGMKPKFMENSVIQQSYYEQPNPYVSAPSCHVNLLELSRYAKKKGYIPVFAIVSSDDNMYSDGEGDDIWNKFFPSMFSSKTKSFSVFNIDVWCSCTFNMIIIYKIPG